MKPFPTIPNADLYLAGGCVRDYLMGREPHDRDFVVKTSMEIDELESVINHSGGNNKVWQSRPEFMTLRCRIDGEDIDLVYPRKEGSYVDKRRPSFVTKAFSLAEDSVRRDFTINAMYMDKEGRVYDFHDGKKDIENAVIKTVDDPEKTFTEDYLRMARAWRFTCTLGRHWVIDPRTRLYIMDNVKMLREVPMERVRDEINKGLLADPRKMFYHLDEFNVLEILQEHGLSLIVTAKDR